MHSGFSCVGCFSSSGSHSWASLRLRSWEERFDALLISVAPDTLELAARRPPLRGEAVRTFAAEAYLFCPDGYGRSKLSNAYLERELRLAATTRNWKTVTALAELAAG